MWCGGGRHEGTVHVWRRQRLRVATVAAGVTQCTWRWWRQGRRRSVTSTVGMQRAALAAAARCLRPPPAPSRLRRHHAIAVNDKVVGGYLGFVGYFCFCAGVSLSSGITVSTPASWLNLALDPQALLRLAPGLAAWLALWLGTRYARLHTTPGRARTHIQRVHMHTRTHAGARAHTHAYRSTHAH